MGLFSKRGSLNLSKAEASNQVHDQIDPKFEKPDNQLDTWTYSVEDDTVETELSFGNSHRVVQDGDEDPPGWSGVTASMDDAGSMNFIPGIATDPKGGVTDFGDSSKGCCAKCRYSCKVAFRPCTTKHNPLPHNPSRWKRFKFAFLCPPHGIVGRTLTCLILVLLLWAVLFTITGAEALPGGNLFGLYVLIISSIVLGLLVNKILRLPALLGMLAAGFILKNVKAIDIANDISREWASALRSIALVVILLRAGLGIDAKALRRLSLVCLRLSFVPSILEAVIIAVASHFLIDFPWEWAFMLGFVLAAVSPAVVVPCLLVLQKGGYGAKKGIPTLAIASCSLDNVLCISAFGVAMGISFSSGSLVLKILQGPLEVLIGVCFGVVAGALLWFIPSKDLKTLTQLRFLFLFCGGLFAVFGSTAASYPGAGALGCLTLAFMAALGWKDEKVAVGKLIGVVWWLFEPILFGLIGAEVALEYLDGETVGLGIATLVLGLVIRIAATWLSVLGAKFTNREKLFMVFAWFPKATVQAALGPLALDEIIKQGIVTEADEANEIRGIQLLTIAVLSILITAPIGAILVTLCGPKLLEKETRPLTVSQQAGELGAGPGDEREELVARQRLSTEY
ncbi:sodium/hydrogen exchanger 9B2 [Strongylocentrotus purpuratus]|uniref:Cation/H+ exchanger transmembrane domain-containing protein n=1 Tax=Strongylocentrotus purpuratus TaxID=7668 RepID=A0A7M7NG07_STRPU|nr:sodium/hydrogen exchanger 9B2 [Strongylocentrotus purpuratus]XP_030835876.1 sodium/hydrogen exchanger 9B2 [Strongylocentrotus purpuratus]